MSKINQLLYMAGAATIFAAGTPAFAKPGDMVRIDAIFVANRLTWPMSGSDSFAIALPVLPSRPKSTTGRWEYQPDRSLE